MASNEKEMIIIISSGSGGSVTVHSHGKEGILTELELRLGFG